MLTNTVKKFWKDEVGLELSEYAVATALIVAALVTAFTGLKDAIVSRLGTITGTINSIT